MTTGQRIRYFRKKKGLTQKELADQIKSTAATITRYEKDQRTPSFSQACLMADCLDLYGDVSLLTTGVSNQPVDLSIKESAEILGKEFAN